MLDGMNFDAVVLDVGETVLDRTREYAAWAEYFGVPAHTFSAVFGAMIADGGRVKDVLERFGAGRSIDELRRDRLTSVPLTEADLYPDVRPTLAALSGVRVAIAGNQPADIGDQLRALDLDVEFVACSAEWGVAKPHPEFFQRLCAELALPAARVVYVGDQLFNDVAAPMAAGLAVIRIRRGPWGLLTNDPDIESQAVAVIESLRELPDLIR
jgi:HAD superfamily hydrolase (TIGR01549 family)